MYRRVDWMVPADDAILRLLGPPKPLELRSGSIARNTGLSRRHVSSRCSSLVDRGLLEKDDDGTHPYYSVTDLGRQYVEQQLEPDDLLELDEE
jgi:DNA-binding IclR family transcriptional regulator